MQRLAEEPTTGRCLRLKSLKEFMRAGPGAREPGRPGGASPSPTESFPQVDSGIYRGLSRDSPVIVSLPVQVRRSWNKL